MNMNTDGNFMHLEIVIKKNSKKFSLSLLKFFLCLLTQCMETSGLNCTSMLSFFTRWCILDKQLQPQAVVGAQLEGDPRQDSQHITDPAGKAKNKPSGRAN